MAEWLVKTDPLNTQNWACHSPPWIHLQLLEIDTLTNFIFSLIDWRRFTNWFDGLIADAFAGWSDWNIWWWRWIMRMQSTICPIHLIFSNLRNRMWSVNLQNPHSICWIIICSMHWFKLMQHSMVSVKRQISVYWHWQWKWNNLLNWLLLFSKWFAPHFFT